MKICFVSNYFWPVTGGIEIHMEKLGVELIKRGHEVIVCTSNEMPNGKKLPSVGEHNKIKIFRYPFKFWFGYYCSLFTPCIRDVDIIHVHGFGMLTNDWVIWRYGKKIPCVMTTHHGIYIPTDKYFNRVYHWVYRNTLGKHSLMLASLIGTDQALDRKRVIALGVSEKKVCVMPEVAVEDSVFNTDFSKYMPDIPFKRYILYVGRLHREKSPSHILYALKKLENEKVCCVFAGPDAGEEKNLKKIAEELGLRERVMFLGKVPEYEKLALIQNAEFLVLPSFYEGFGAVILESWALGKTVLATKSGGIPYVVEDNVDGLLYTWGNIEEMTEKMKQLYLDKELCVRLGRNGKKNAYNNFRRTIVVDRIERAYMKVISQHQKRLKFHLGDRE